MNRSSIFDVGDLAQRLISRQDVERRRIARELHDDISQRIALLNIEVVAISTHVDSEQLCARLSRLSALIVEIAGDLQHLSYNLHPSRLELVGLVAALQSLCSDTSKRPNLHVAFTHGPIPPVDANVSLCLYRIGQEALDNVVRHSHAREAQLSVRCDAGHIELQIADSGVGFDPRHVVSTGLGLVSIEERVAMLKGQLAIDAAPGKGTRIAVRIPLLSEATISAAPFGQST